MDLIRVLFSWREKRIMDQSNNPAITPAIRHNGWTEERRAAFLEHLAGHGSVRAACARAGMSHEAAYRLRRRDELFARGWAAALLLAREASAEVLACRAIDGVEEEVWHRGEVVGTRRRYDTRLLLAHMARLDALAADERALADVARFDELVALAAGARPPEDLGRDADGLPLARERAIDRAIEIAVEAHADEVEESGVGGELCPTERYLAGARAAACWDAWLDDARLTVDRLLERSSGASGTPSTVSTVSTSPLADGPAYGQPGASG
jgi:hypothetical protein